LKKILFISLAVVLVLSVALVGCSAPTQYTLTTASGPGGSVFPAAGDHTYSSGQVVDIKATAASDYYEFVKWTGDVDTIENVNAATTKITMDGDYSIRATFQEKPWDSTITLACHFTVPNAQTSVAAKVYLPWIAELEAITGTQGGKFKVDVTYGDTPYDSTTGLFAISTGVVDMGQLSGDNFKLGGIGYLPWFFPSIESAAYATHLLWTEGNAKWDTLGELDNIKVLVSSPLWGDQWFGNFQATTLAAFDGQKVRAEASETAIIQALGAVPVPIPTSDLANSLNLNTIAGLFFTYSAWNFGVDQATDYCTEVNMKYRPYLLAMNRAVYEGLPSEAQTAIDSLATPEKSVALAKAHLASQGFSKGKILALHPIDTLSAAELDNWKAATSSVKTDWVAYMTGLTFDGAGIIARAEALIAATPS
jgi:TRAP-type C4-dicarboxylate transport system substrate-binding protein